MPEPGQLNVNDRVLLHLSRFATDIPPEEHPGETAQTGIAAAVGISRTHIPRAVKGLIKDGLVEEITARVRGHERRMNVYVITAEGLRRAEELWRAVNELSFKVERDGVIREMKGRDIEAAVGKRRAVAAVSQIRDGVVEIDEARRAPIHDIKDAPAIERFYGREPELKAMDEFMESDAKVLVLLANRGYGTSTLARKFVNEQDEADVLWIPLSAKTSTKELQDRMADFAKRVNHNAQGSYAALSLKNALIVFDDFFSVGEEVVEFFSSLVDNIQDTKVIITARQETPAYNWFYHKAQVDSGAVQELKLRGLDEDSARRLLGNERIEEDAFRRVFMMTRGQPLALKLLKDGDEKGLQKNTVFTVEEIRYLVFLKDKTA